MATKPNLKSEAVREILAEFPNATSKTIARIACKKHPKLFLSLESTRSIVRYVRGASGESHRKKIADKSMLREPEAPGDPFGDLPEPKSEWDAPWSSFPIEGPAKILLLPDTHVPFHDKTATSVALNYGRDRGVDAVVLNGDTWDAFSVSAWQTDPRQRDLPGEVKMVREYLRVIRNGFPNARLIYKIGNHEERWERYLMVKAPEVLDMAEFQMGAVLRLADVGAELVTDMRPIKAGALYIIHGHEYRFNISNPVNPARGFFLRAKTHVIGSHLHQTSQHSENTLDDSAISTFSTGCLCSLHPRYRPLNNWNAGFAIISIDKGGGFEVDNRRIRGGKAW